MKWNAPETITKVTDCETYFDIQVKGMGFSLSKEYNCTPKVGDTLELKGSLGMSVAGVKINGELIFEKTKEDLDREHEEWKKRHEINKKEEFEKNRAEHDANYEALPLIFKKRIDRLRRNNPHFRWDAEAYDVFACKEAIKIASVIKTAEELQAFGKMDYNEQIKIVPLDEGHSGGTFGQAMQLAHCLLVNEKYIPFIHSSLAHIAGCENIGCTPPTEAEKKEYGLDL